ncbi:MAG: hypothetical protein ACI8XO_003858 [Verrucomicrobiales bacterium]|jgi:hypothetical protein
MNPIRSAFCSLAPIALALLLASCAGGVQQRSSDRLDRRLEVRDSRLDTSLDRVDQREQARSGRWEKRSEKADAQAERRFERLTN